MLNTAKAAAYSGMLMLFPTFVVLTTIIAIVPEGPTVVGEIRSGSSNCSPSTQFADAFVDESRALLIAFILSAATLSVFAGSACC